MNKKPTIIILILIFILAAVTLASCNRQASSIRFSEDSYVLYYEGGREAAPGVTIKPKNSAYSLISSNPAIVRILEDGKTVQAAKREGIVTLKAVSGGLTAEAVVFVYPKRNSQDPAVPGDKYTVDFDTGGRSSVASQEVSPGGLAVRPVSPTFTDYEIEDWYLDEEFTERYNFSKPVSSNLTLYAHWVLKGEPSFLFAEKEGGVYVTGLKYPSLSYENVIIPDSDPDGKPVAGIEEKAFYVLSGTAGSTKNIITAKKLVIPSTVKVIGKNAFSALENLTEIIFDGESRLETIGDEAFLDCKKLTEFTIPTAVTSIGKKAFSGCEKLNIESLPQGLTSLAESVFEKTATLKINLINITEVGYRALYGSKLQTIENPENLVRVESGAFANTPWREFQRVNNMVGSISAVYLDKILIYFYTNSTAAFDYTVRSDTRLISNDAFTATSNGIVRFETETPPQFGSYVFPKSLILIAPETAVETYKNISSGYYKKQVYYEKTVNDLKIFVRTELSGETETEKIIIYKYTKGTSPGLLNIKNDLYNLFGDDLTIEKIKTSAFSKISGLVTVVLPPRIEEIETNAFNDLTNFGSLRIEGEYHGFTPSASNLKSSAINPLHSNYYIYVAPGLVTAYKNAWTQYKDKIIAIP